MYTVQSRYNQSTKKDSWPFVLCVLNDMLFPFLNILIQRSSFRLFPPTCDDCIVDSIIKKKTRWLLKEKKTLWSLISLFIFIRGNPHLVALVIFNLFFYRKQIVKISCASLCSLNFLCINTQITILLFFFFNFFIPRTNLGRKKKGRKKKHKLRSTYFD